MKEGDVVLVAMPQANGSVKNRPAIILREMPPFQDMLVCGVSTRLPKRLSILMKLLHPAIVILPQAVWSENL
ncbi:MAG: hypothetical protein ACRD6X_06295 [Pyrinomonadaceae bacterium]